ncbi:MAG: glycosyltransferase [Chloroflexi bacterium]|nr:glycosyltransferase [Chloroflexota bacterium]
MQLSIIIVTYRPGAILDACLQSLAVGVGSLTYETIVVDNNSQDGTDEKIRTTYPDVRLIANPENKGFASANNLGLAQAGGDYLLLLNPDVVVEPGSLQRLVEFMEGDAHVGVTGPRVLDAQGKVALSAYGAYTPFSVLWQYFGLVDVYPYVGFGHYWKRLRTATNPLEVEWLQGCCLLIRRGVYAQIGGLDDGLFMFAEEPDFCERARNAGWKIKFFPAAQIQHFESTTVSRFPLLRMRHYHISPLHYFRKRGKSAAVALLKFSFIMELFTKYGIRLLQHGLKPSDNLKAKVEAYPVVLKEIWHF